MPTNSLVPTQWARPRLQCTAPHPGTGLSCVPTNAPGLPSAEALAHLPIGTLTFLSALNQESPLPFLLPPIPQQLIFLLCDICLPHAFPSPISGYYCMERLLGVNLSPYTVTPQYRLNVPYLKPWGLEVFWFSHFSIIGIDTTSYLWSRTEV